MECSSDSNFRIREQRRSTIDHSKEEFIKRKGKQSKSKKGGGSRYEVEDLHNEGSPMKRNNNKLQSLFAPASSLREE